MIIMAEVGTQSIDDLEDGEIESDDEQAEPEPTPALAPRAKEPTLPAEELKSRPPDKDIHSKKSESRHDKKERKRSKDRHSKSDRDYKSHKEAGRKFLLPTPVEDDFAGNIEKAIRMALKKGNNNSKKDAEKFDNEINDSEVKRKHKKRKKHNQPDKESSKKRRKNDEDPPEGDDMDEDEMMCVRGASPVLKQGPIPDATEDYPSEEEYDSASSVDSRGGRDRGGRGGRGRGSGGRERRTDRARVRSRRQDVHPMQDPDGVCLFYMQGKCYKGDDCTYSHDAQPPRKMELCKFYLMDCCAKRDKCLYLHSDFPCKYYHTGLQCIYKDDECKFAHGKPLSDNLRMILLKHIESAPKEILGDFPRLSRESAAMMVANTQNKLLQQYSPKKSGSKEKSIPSIFELNVPKPVGFEDNQQSNSSESGHHDKNKMSSKVRQSRWCDSANKLPLLSTPFSNNSMTTETILSVQNLNGVLTPKQITELRQLGIENLNQLSQLTVIQLNRLGLTMNQINDIQLNTMSIQKFGLIHNQSSTSTTLFPNAKLNKDLDMRVPSVISDISLIPKTDILVKDVDMRFQPSNLNIAISNDVDNRSPDAPFSNDPRTQKPCLDIDQYTKDALKYSQVEKENVNTSVENPDENKCKVPKKPADMDIDHRVLKYISDATVVNVKLSKEEEVQEFLPEKDDKMSMSTLKPHDVYLNNQKKIEQARRVTTDDEDDNLQIDEKWYSSDEERSDKVVASKIKLPPVEDPPKFYTPVVEPSSIDPTTVITKLGDLSKIDISAEVTKLFLSSIKSAPTEEKELPKKEESKLRDPRNLVKKSPEHKPSTEIPKKTSSKPNIVSIYNCIEGGTGDGRKRIDIDLRPIQDLDLRLPTFGDTDLRQAPVSGDVDLRLGLPFKPLPNYTPASELDGSYNSHPPIPFKLVVVDVPRPDYTDIRNSTPKSQAATDPRLRKIFRLSVDENPLESSDKAITKPPSSVRSDPRKRTQGASEKPSAVKPSSLLDLQSVIQTSNWYKELSSNQKILVNQQLASVTISLKKFHQDKTPGKVFDLSEIHSNSVLTKIFANLGIILSDKGEFTQVQLPDTPQVPISSMNFNQNETFGNAPMGGMLESPGMMGMNPMGPPNMGPMNSGPMGNFDMRFQGPDPRGAPGLLGIAPNIPHNFDANFNGMPNFNNDSNFNGNFENSGMFNGPGKINEYHGEGNYDEKFYRNQKTDFKSYRGNRGGERWRGSRGRDRRGYSDRGSWKGERR